jgi:hypothetical protein
MVDVGIFYGNLFYFTTIKYTYLPTSWQFLYFVAIWYILWSFGTIFSRFGMLYQEKSGNPGSERRPTKKF